MRVARRVEDADPLFHISQVSELQLPKSTQAGTLVICNPPYEKRLQSESMASGELYAGKSVAMLQRHSHWRSWH